MKIYILLISLSMGLAQRAIKAPYLPSGWRPNGPAFELPTEMKKTVLASERITDFQPEESSFLREYGPPNIELLNPVQDSITSVEDSVTSVQDSISSVQDSISTVQESVSPIPVSIKTVKDSMSLILNSGDQKQRVQNSVNLMQDSIDSDQDTIDIIEDSINPDQDSISLVQDSINLENGDLQDKSQIVSEEILQDLTVQALPDEEINLDFRKIPDDIEVRSDSLTEQSRKVSDQSRVEDNSEENSENEGGKINFDVVLVNERTLDTEIKKGIVETETPADVNKTEEKSSEINVPAGFREYGPPSLPSQESKTQDNIYQAPEYLPPQGFKRNVRKIRLVSTAPNFRNRR